MFAASFFTRCAAISASKGVIAIRLSLRDMEILHDILKKGHLSRSYITDRYFHGNRTYTYRRLNMLKHYGLIRGRRRRENGLVIARYELTEEGKKRLGSCGRLHGERSVFHDQPNEPVRKRNRPRKWTERDIAILNKLFQVRVLTKRQIEQTFFKGSTKYAGKRLSVMQREQLIASKVSWSREKGCLEASYRIAEKGLRLLCQKGLISEVEVRARDLEPTDKQREYLFDVNELHLRCQHIPFMDSRLLKRKYHLNRGDLVAGAFIWGGKDYMIFLANSAAREKTIVKILSEIRNAPKDVAGFLVYCKDEKARQSFERCFENMGIVTGGLPVHVLPFGDKGIWITQNIIFDGEEKLLGILKGFGQIVSLPANRNGFKYGIVLPDGSRHFVLEVLSGNRILLDRILREYAGQHAGVLLFCWEDETKLYKERVAGARFIRVVSVPAQFQKTF